MTQAIKRALEERLRRIKPTKMDQTLLDDLNEIVKRCAALPVIDEFGVLVGRITADDVIDVNQEEATEDMYRLAALSDQDDLSEPVGITAWRRGVWLAVNLCTAILASFVIAQFEATIAQIVALAILMPIVASMGGIAGTQTLTIIVRGIALGETAKHAMERLLSTCHDRPQHKHN